MEREKLKGYDDVLVQMCKKGYSKAFDQVVKKYSGAVKGYIFQIVRDPMLTEDILQDTFLKAIMSIREGKYYEKGSLKEWLMRIAHNLCIDYFRKKNRIPEAYTIATSGDFEKNGKVFSFPTPSLDPNVEEKLISRETDYDVIKFVKRLPRAQIEVFLLRKFHDFSFKEIAGYTNVSINTALGRMRYALINIRKMQAELERAGKRIV